ncbi:Papain family cysteine protease [Mucilaginibacter sp. OK268]|uniref:C1 family peptidase n=1 Tax=Mucilaginibacter sp. OK268 TaxID=1881048 RepID=UPI0008815994|nr:C1 family peptidase [Mucilaginibacter sp. OK268]SDP72142.1 Papain family cysteine protease [Mucilaginibacter sp. OK268]
MKTNLNEKSLLIGLLAMFMLYGCSKSEKINPVKSQEPDVNASTQPGSHVYGLLPTSKAEYESVPKFSMEAFRSKFNLNAVSTPAPPVVTLTTPDIRDQGQIGSCTGFCGTEAYEIAYKYKYGSFPTLLSPAFLYYEERVNIEGYRINADPGANMVNIGQALTKYGITTEALMLYPNPAATTTAAYKTKPTSTAISTALNYKISNYTYINPGDTAAVKTCLRANIPVMMGFTVYDNASAGYPYFEALNTSSYTYNPLTSGGAIVSGAKVMGGHAVPIIGYDDTKKAFLVQNSWGSSWGNKGFFYMPYTVFSNTNIVTSGDLYYLSL